MNTARACWVPATRPRYTARASSATSADRPLKLHLYILRQLLVAFLFAVGALLFIALPGIAVSTVHKLPNVDAAILLRFLPLVLQSLAPYVLPLCFMLSVVAVFGRLAADKEWIAIHMAGIRPIKTLFMPFVVATLLGCLTFWMASNELPQLKKRQKRFLVDATASVIENLQPGKTSLQLGDFLLISEYRNPRTGVFYRAFFRYRREDSAGRQFKDVWAGEVDIWIDGDFLRLRAKDVELFDPATGNWGQGNEALADINIADRIERNDTHYDRAKYLVSSEIRRRLKGGTLEPKQVQEFRYMLHYRASMFAIFYLFLGLGAATGLLMRRGTQLGALAVAAGYGIVYYVLSMRLGKELGQASTLPPWIGAWTATIGGGVVAVLLLRRALHR